jgi:hypothetical protein
VPRSSGSGKPTMAGGGGSSGKPVCWVCGMGLKFLKGM